MLVGGADGGWRDWWVAVVVGVSVVGEAAVVGVLVGAGDGEAVPRTPWLSYGLRSTNPMHGREDAR